MQHRIERTRNKHSRAVVKGDTIVIRLARNLSANEEREHAEHLLRRMQHVILREKKRALVRPFQSLIDGENQLTLSLPTGRTYRFFLVPKPRTRTVKSADGWAISVAPGMERRSLHHLLWSLLSREELPHMRERVRKLNEISPRVKLRNVRLGYMTSQWGSCSSGGDVTLNAALLFLPLPLLDYVIIHELTHRIVRNHSAAFWREVERVIPGYQTARKALMNYRLPPL